MRTPRLSLLILSFCLGLFASAEAQTVWTNVDIGTVGAAGSSSYNSGNLIRTTNAAGTGLGGTADAFHFSYSQVDPDFEMTVKVETLPTGNSTAQAGLMVRESVAPDSKFAFVYFSVNDGLQFSVRSVPGAQSRRTPGSSDVPPGWLRLLKVGNNVYGYASADGASWDLVGQDTLVLSGAQVLVGTAVCSGVTGVLNAASFSGESLLSNLPYRVSGLTAWLRADAGVTKDANGRVSRWSDQSTVGNDAFGNATVTTRRPVWEASPALVNGKPFLTFNSTESRALEIPHDASLNSGNLTIMAVVRRTAGTAAAMVAGKWPGSQNSQYALYMNNATTPRLFVRGASTYADGLITAGNFGLVTGTYDQSVIRMYINGIQSAQTTFTTGMVLTDYKIWIGGYDGILYLDGNIAELLIFNRALSDTERTRLEAYFAQKYLTASTPKVAPITLTPGTPAPALYATSQTVGINVPAGSRVYYTTNESEPTESSTLYTGPITVTGSTTTLKFKAFRSGYVASDPLTVRYVIDSTSTFTRSGLVLWLRADEATFSSGNSVTRWNDLSGLGNHANQATVANQPLRVSGAVNGKPVLNFGGGVYRHFVVKDHLSLNNPNVHIVAVTRRNSGSNQASIAMKWATGIPSQYAFQFTNATDIRLSINSYSSFASGYVTPSSFAVAAGTYDGTSIRAYVNGTQTGNATFGTGMAGNADMLVGGLNASNYFDGDIAELLIFSRVLTAQERQDLDIYLYLRYGLGTQPQVGAVTVVGGKIGGVFPTPQTVSVNAPPESSIFYTTDGLEPADTSMAYTGPVTVSSNSTLKFKAFRAGYDPSPTLVGTYTIDPQTTFTRNGLKAWMRSDQTVSANGSVSQWNDVSGNGNHATQNATTSRPALVNGVINGQPVLRFNGSSSWMSGSSNALVGSDYTIFGVLKYNNFAPAGVAYPVRVKSSVSGAEVIVSQGTLYGQLSVKAGQSAFGANSTSNVTLGQFGVSEYVYGGGSGGLGTVGNFVNGYNGSVLGNYTTISSFGNGTFNLNEMGRWQGGGGHFLNADFAELMIFDRALTAVERDEVRSYLYLRYVVGNPPPAVAPVINGVAGGIFVGPQVVGVNVAPGTSVYYTTDGNEPSEASTPYTAGIPISTTTTLKLKAFRSGYASSATVVANYVFDSQATFSRSGLVAWMRGDQAVISTNGTVSQWPDQSGNGNHAFQGVPAKQPTLTANATGGKPALTFNSSLGKCLMAPSSLSLNVDRVSVLAVIRRTSGNATAVLARAQETSSTPRYSLHMFNATEPRMRINGTTFAGGGNLTLGAFGVVAGTFDQSTIKTWGNGTLNTPTAYAAAIQPGASNVWIGGDDTGSFLDGEIAELMIFNRAINDAERQEIEAYFQLRYGVGTKPPIATPSLSASTIFSTPMQFTATSLISGTTIRYTTDGSDPTETSAIYDPGNRPLITANTTVKVRVFREGYNPSAVVSATYTFEPPSTTI